MTRAEILENYEVRDGRIVSPGQFEGETIYIPYFWDVFLNGDADEDDGTALTFYVLDEDVAEFPELAGIVFVAIYQDDQGFVREL
jgi:hypothetical protein